jgi:hypothetical protein
MRVAQAERTVASGALVLTVKFRRLGTRGAPWAELMKCLGVATSAGSPEARWHVRMQLPQLPGCTACCRSAFMMQMRRAVRHAACRCVPYTRMSAPAVRPMPLPLPARLPAKDSVRKGLSACRSAGAPEPHAAPACSCAITGDGAGHVHAWQGATLPGSSHPHLPCLHSSRPPDLQRTTCLAAGCSESACAP